MLVYGDQVRSVSPAAMAEGIARRLARARVSRGRRRHDALVEGLIEGGALWQGLADAGCEEAGARALTLALARAVVASLESGFEAEVPDLLSDLAGCRGLACPPSLLVRIPEGYAFYDLRPEAYLRAAREAVAPGQPAIVIGVRSIGTSLAAVAAAALGSEALLSVRPGGPAFAREAAPCPALSLWLSRLPGAAVLVVDEGPGLSGSSLAAVGAMAEAAGARDIVFLPSHCGEPGAAASLETRARWAATRRVPAGLDGEWADALDASRAIADLAGPLDGPPLDLSGGRWRDLRPGECLPAIPHLERRKILAWSEGRPFLAKFAGLGRIGREKFVLARRFATQGLIAPPVGLTAGYIVEPWHDGARGIDPVADRPALLASLARWLAVRASLPAPAEAGADLPALATMIRRNLALGLRAREGEVAIRLPLAPRTARIRRVWTDGRWGAWEWLKLADGRVMKSDTLDHARGHDLVGAQDIAFDLAAARVELALTAGETDDLARELGSSGGGVDPHLLAFYGLAYRAFAFGMWRMAMDALPPESADHAIAEGRAARLLNDLIGCVEYST